jgi:hypothetical protein
MPKADQAWWDDYRGRLERVAKQAHDRVAP